MSLNVKETVQQRPLACVILAAGKGTRMKSRKPKVLHEVAGLPILKWVINAAERLTPEFITVVVGPDTPDVEKLCSSHRVAIQQERLGTGDALKAALPSLGDFEGDILVLVGDAPLVSERTLRNLVAARYQDHHTGLSVLGARVTDPSGYGRMILKQGNQLERIVEDKDARPKEKLINVINAGMYCIDTRPLADWLSQLRNDNAQGEYYLTDLPQIAAEYGAKTAVSITDNEAEVRGCNTRIDLSFLEGYAQLMLRDEAMLGGATLTDPASVYLSYDTVIGQDVTIEPNVYIAKGVKIGDGCHVKANSYLEDTVIKKNTVIGPFARIRPGSVIGEDVKIGNFVEIKKSTIGDRSKISHLSYVGDCEMGEDVNFGAGAITVNYDGFQKHKTLIGNGVMVGSNVNLVAPLSIDDGAFVAAGSTIKEDVPRDSLSISGDVAHIREGWASEYRRRKQALLKKLRKGDAKKEA